MLLLFLATLAAESASASESSCKAECREAYSLPWDEISGTRLQCEEGCKFFFTSQQGTAADCKSQCGIFTACGAGCEIGYAVCKAGDFCSGNRRVTCPAGQYCVERGGEAPLLCDAGRFCLEGEVAPTGSGPCEAGRWCPKGSQGSQGARACAAGKYCLAGTPVELECDPGRFCLAGSSTRNGTGDCSAGRFCGAGSATSGGDGPCDIGYYCAAGSTHPNAAPCPAGHFCESGTVEPQPCPAGTASALGDVEGHGLRSCRVCSPGHFSAGPGSAACEACDPGTWQTESGKERCEPCESGWWGTGFEPCEACPPDTYLASPLNNTRPEHCVPCPEGTSSSRGSGNAKDCVLKSRPPCRRGPGYYWASSEDVECTRCEEGFKCPGTGAREVCEEGTYQPEAGSPGCRLCPAGRYGPIAGATALNDCVECDAGRYNAYYGESKGYACVQCPPGRANPNKGSPTVAWCANCTLGEYTGISGSAVCSKCANGEYSDAPGAFACMECKPNHYQDPAAPRTSEQSCKACPASTWSPPGSFGQTSCVILNTLCDEGLVIGEDGRCVCPAGFWGLEGSTSCTPCDNGTASPTQGAISKDACVPCPPTTVAGKGSMSCHPDPEQWAQLGDAQALAAKLMESAASTTLLETTAAVATSKTVVGEGEFVGVCVALSVLALSLVVLHPLIPPQVFLRADFTALSHKIVEQGASPQLRNTQLGSAWSFAFLPISAIITMALVNANKQVSTSTLSVPNGRTARGNFALKLSAEAGGDDYCPIAGENAVEGLVCDTMVFAGCEFRAVGCEFRRPVALLDFRVEWNVRVVGWTIVVDAAAPGAHSGTFGVVKPETVGRLMQGRTTVALQVVPSFWNDTTASGASSTGFRIFPLPSASPGTVAAPNLRVVAGSTWDLRVELRRAETVFETNVAMQQGPFQVFSSVIATLFSVLAAWRSAFGVGERLVEKVRAKGRKFWKSRDNSLGDMELEAPQLGRTVSTDLRDMREGRVTAVLPNPMVSSGRKGY